MVEHKLEETVAVLERTPGALDALLRGLPEIWILRNEGDQTWNAREVLGHLIHGERTDWLPRARMILEFGEGRAFEPFTLAIAAPRLTATSSTKSNPKRKPKNAIPHASQKISLRAR